MQTGRIVWMAALILVQVASASRDRDPGRLACLLRQPDYAGQHVGGISQQLGAGAKSPGRTIRLQGRHEAIGSGIACRLGKLPQRRGRSRA